jgi:hypothetical protein
MGWIVVDCMNECIAWLACSVSSRLVSPCAVPSRSRLCLREAAWRVKPKSATSASATTSARLSISHHRPTPSMRRVAISRLSRSR